MRYIYIATCDPGLIKIGISVNPKQRMANIVSDLPRAAVRGTMKLRGAFEGTRTDEADLHRRLARFLAGSKLEWYTDCPELQAEVDGMFVIPPSHFEPIPYSDSKPFNAFKAWMEEQSL